MERVALNALVFFQAQFNNSLPLPLSLFFDQQQS